MAESTKISRKRLLGGLLAAATGTAIIKENVMAETTSPVAADGVKEIESGIELEIGAVEAAGITLEDLAAFEKVAAFALTNEQRKEILIEVNNSSRGFANLRKIAIPYTIEPPTIFTPIAKPEKGVHRIQAKVSPVKISRKSLSEEDIAFLSVRELSSLIKSRQISPVELTHIFLDRLKKYGDKLLCLVTLTESLALKQAVLAEKEIAAGHYRGPLHGIPYGLKDLFVTKGIPTTWGAEPYKNQVFDYDATIVKKLEDAGAILVAKLSMGSLAQGDVWFKGTTKNPWNLEQGSSGSSAGPGSATAAGLVGFSIGTETLGSIASPSVRCRVTGLRPTYGRVSRYGAMGLSYTMDKIGPMCREVEDCALVFSAICGVDPNDATIQSARFQWRPKVDWTKLKIGYLVNDVKNAKNAEEMKSDPILSHFHSLGAQVRAVHFTPLPPELYLILGVEAASAFDDFTLSDQIEHLKDSEWPSSFRVNRHIPAVEYLRAQRVRVQVMRRFEEEFGDLDLFAAFGEGQSSLSLTNFTGHPQVIIPTGADDKNHSLGRSFIGRPFKEDLLLAVAREAQETMDFHRRRPDLSKL